MQVQTEVPVDCAGNNEYNSPTKMVKANNPQRDWTSWAAPVLMAVALGGGTVWALHVEFSKIDDHLSKIDSRLVGVDAVLRVLSASQSGDVKEVINQILSQAREQASLGNFSTATHFLAVALKLTTEEAQRRAPAGTEFFQAAFENLNRLRASPNRLISQQARTAKTTLAEYRSAITPVGPNPPQNRVQGGFVGGPIVENARIENGNQPLDGINWVNVVFENVHITYRGEPTELRNVRFVNCTFDVSGSPIGDELLNVAILGISSADLG